MHLYIHTTFYIHNDNISRNTVVESRWRTQDSAIDRAGLSKVDGVGNTTKNEGEVWKLVRGRKSTKIRHPNIILTANRISKRIPIYSHHHSWQSCLTTDFVPQSKNLIHVCKTRVQTKLTFTWLFSQYTSLSWLDAIIIVVILIVVSTNGFHCEVYHFYIHNKNVTHNHKYHQSCK